MRVGHAPEMRVCNTTNPSTELVSGVRVGNFGENTGWTDARNSGPRYAEPRATKCVTQMRGEPQLTYLRISVSGSLHSVDN